MEDVNIVICGAAGQGIKTVEKLLTRIFAKSGYFVFSTKEYMSRIRGGSNATDLRISGRPPRCPVERVDLLITLDEAALAHMQGRISDKTVVIMDGEAGRQGVHAIPLKQLAKEAGRAVYANTVAAGIVAGALGLGKQEGQDLVGTFFSKLGDEDKQGNAKAFATGWEKGEALHTGLAVQPGQAAGQLLMSGGTAVGLGALAGNVRFICSYPMSPSTAVLIFLAQHAREFGVVVEQAEDEISAVNMGLGAWFTGARAMVTTSGGGLALMTEGISLAGMTETPLVLHVAQRPGPATGLPTRTAQEDLDLVLHAGHGEFPRIILAPGNLEQAFLLTARAFWLAEKYQVPVFILTDQYLMDSFYQVPELRIGDVPLERFMIKPGENYKRYALGKGPLSPMGIPGTGEGLVCLDSDEHDTEGHISEDLDVRVQMVDKRRGKLKEIARDVLEPEVSGQGRHVVVCWGSTRPVCLEAVKRTGRDDVAVCHVSQVYPISRRLGELLEQAETVITVENNASGQFGRLMAELTGRGPDHEILRYDGLPFKADTLAGDIAEILQRSGA